MAGLAKLEITLDDATIFHNAVMGKRSFFGVPATVLQGRLAWIGHRLKPGWAGRPEPALRRDYAGAPALIGDQVNFVYGGASRD
jgi:hypothetical protein